MTYRKNKKSINYLEFQGGYALVCTTVIDAVIHAYREGLFRKNELRVFAALHERSAMHKETRVDLYRAVNHGSGIKGVKRLSHKEIDAALEAVMEVVAETDDGQRKPVSRKFLRYIAKGSASGAETLMLLYYCKRRIRQPKAYGRLAKKERFARFTYRELSEASGLRRATLSDALGRLTHRGLLNTAAVAKQNENVYGMLYIDGARVSLTRVGADNVPYRVAVKKTVTPVKQNRMTPPEKTATLKNEDPKTEIKGASLIDKKEQGDRMLRRAMQSKDPVIRGVAERLLIGQQEKHRQAA